MKTTYVPHLFGDAAQAKLTSRQGWLTAGVVSSIAWPREDVWVLYDSHEYVLRGVKGGGDKHPPCISTPSTRDELDAATTRIYQFVSVLGWFKGGYVDVTGTVWGSGPILYGSRDTFTTTLDGGKYFSCNYMPVIPVNIVPQIPEEMVAKALDQFRKRKAQAQVPAAPASAAPGAPAPSPATTHPAEVPGDERLRGV